jgi:hypothetical protein
MCQGSTAIYRMRTLFRSNDVPAALGWNGLLVGDVAAAMEPDASAASYFWGAHWLLRDSGSRITVKPAPASGMQVDQKFRHLMLEQAWQPIFSRSSDLADKHNDRDRARSGSILAPCAGQRSRPTATTASQCPLACLGCGCLESACETPRACARPSLPTRSRPHMALSGPPARAAQCLPIEEKRTSEWTQATAI